jgi:alpha-glucosidase
MIYRRSTLSFSYRLLDYIYTAFHQAKIDGTPVLNPLWFIYPKDPATYPIDLQFFYGSSLLVSPVTEENSTSVTIYLPSDIFYNLQTLAPVQGHASNVTLTNIPFTEIPLHIRGGVILPMRVASAMTTTQLRKTDFEFVVAPGTNGKASGALYLDDGVSITPSSTTEVTMSYANGQLIVQGEFRFKTGVRVAGVKFLSVSQAPKSVRINGRNVGEKAISYDAATQVLAVNIGLPFVGDMMVQYT